MTEQETKNRVIVMVTATLCVFLLVSLFGAYALAWTDRDPGEVWTKVFDLVSVLAGALVGYIAGQQVQKARDADVNPLPDVPDIHDGDEGA